MEKKPLGFKLNSQGKENYCALQVTVENITYISSKNKKQNTSFLQEKYLTVMIVPNWFLMALNKNGICLQSDLINCTCKRDKYLLQNTQRTLTPNCIANSGNVTIANCSNNVDFLSANLIYFQNIWGMTREAKDLHSKWSACATKYFSSVLADVVHPQRSWKWSNSFILFKPFYK